MATPTPSTPPKPPASGPAAAPKPLGLLLKIKIGSWLLAALLLGGLVGWLYAWGSANSLRTEVESTRLQRQLLEARTQILDARINIYSVNFGDASRNLEYAKGPMRTARELLDRAGKRELAAKLEAATVHATEAQQLASKLSQDANGRAGEASRLVYEVLQATSAGQ